MGHLVECFGIGKKKQPCFYAFLFCCNNLLLYDVKMFDVRLKQVFLYVYNYIIEFDSYSFSLNVTFQSAKVTFYNDID